MHVVPILLIEHSIQFRCLVQKLERNALTLVLIDAASLPLISAYR